MKRTLCVILVALVMGSCTFYEDFLHPNVTNLEQLYDADTTYKHLASYSWRELFTDSLLQGYIEKGLEYNIDVRTAKYNIEAAEAARRVGLGLNAGHDLSLENLTYFAERIAWCDEVSIGHALIADALYYGLENTVQLYRRCLASTEK